MDPSHCLDEHQRRRALGSPCISVLHGRLMATWALLKAWLDGSGRGMAMVRGSGLRAVAAAYTDTLLRLGDPRSTLLAFIRPHHPGQPHLSPEAWDTLSPIERSAWLIAWPTDSVTRSVAERLLAHTGNTANPSFPTLEELATVTHLLGGNGPPGLTVIISGPSSHCIDLNCLVDIANHIPAMPIVLMADDLAFDVIQKAADRGERIAAFIRDGAIACDERLGARQPLQTKFCALPSELADCAHSLDVYGAPERVLDAFVAAATVKPEAASSVFDSRAEEFLAA